MSESGLNGFDPRPIGIRWSNEGLVAAGFYFEVFR